MQVELWKNPNKGKIQIVRYHPSGSGTRPEIINGGQEFRITADERQMNISEAHSEAQSPFVNGRLLFMKHIDTAPTAAGQGVPQPAPSAPPAPAAPAPAAEPPAPAPVPEPQAQTAPAPAEPPAPAPTPADPAPAPSITEEDIDVILNEGHRSAYPRLKKITQPAVVARLYAMSLEPARDVGSARQQYLRNYLLTLDPKYPIAEPGQVDAGGASPDDGYPTPMEYDQDTGQPLGTARDAAATPGVDEPDDPTMPADPEAPLVLANGGYVDGTPYLLPGTTVPEGAAPPSGLMPGEVPGTTI